MWYIIIGLIVLLLFCPFFFFAKAEVDESMKIRLSLFFLPLMLFGSKKKLHIRTLGNKKIIRWPLKAKDKRKISLIDSWKFLKRMISRIDIRDLNISVEIGSGNAAASCLLAGGLWGSASGMLAFLSSFFKKFPAPPLISIRPDFTARRFFCCGECIFAIRFGDIILGLCYIIWFIISRKGIKKWRDKVISRA